MSRDAKANKDTFTAALRVIEGDEKGIRVLGL
jgi:hypothetical protein